ncbi:hypothetical protein F2Q65_07510 [Thiohalocapsa marina]|uniref:Porin n=1 Tax=Thiohalocapsa marina TaxID=424902 RepID=A0A5M8FM79_9GAMM|nr:hypothetical protein [Thiohalocapsa marina]KAA6185837.1 hypothetical protein F2Q65_07510 [Thiohalocapsa marina]
MSIASRTRVLVTPGLLCAALLMPLQTAAVDLSLHGFGTLAASRSSDGSAEPVRDLSQPSGITDAWSLTSDSLIGLQGNLRFSPTLEAVVQGISRYRYDGTYTPEITWAFVGFSPDPVWTLRAGRLGTEFYMLSDSRWVGYSFNTVRPPSDYYGTLPFNYVDGMDLAVTHPFAGGLLKGKLFGGESREQSPFGDLRFDLDGSLLLGGYVEYYLGDLQARIVHVGVRFANDLPLDAFYRTLPAATANELRVADRWSQFSSLGIVHDRGPLQTQFMLSRTHNDHGTFQDTWAGYLALNYRIGDWTPFIGLSMVKSEAKDLKHPIPGVTDLYQADFHSDHRTLLIGTRWDFRPNMALKAQVDLIRGSPDSIFLFRQETPDWDGSMNLFTLSLDVVF